MRGLGGPASFLYPLELWTSPVSAFAPIYRFSGMLKESAEDNEARELGCDGCAEGHGMLMIKTGIAHSIVRTGGSRDL